MENYYAILKLKNFANSEDIKLAYRRLVKLYHPDANIDSKNNIDLFRQVQEAYEVLRNITNKKNYDEQLKRELQIKRTNSKNKERHRSFTAKERNDYYHKEYATYLQNQKKKRASMPHEEPISEYKEYSLILITIPIAVALLLIILYVYEHK